MLKWCVLSLAFLTVPLTVLAQDTTTVEANSEEIGADLDLELVASIFGESEDLEDFENRLNDPEAEITNLDMNEDGEVDYLRVLETVEGETHFIAIQAVLGDDKYQDVATIEVEKDSSGETQVQVVGDVYMYGPNYICEPVYVHPPVFFVIFWTPYYSPWYSPWYWGHHPPHYHSRHRRSHNHYRTNVEININVNNSYNYTSVRKSETSVKLQKDNRRNDFGKDNPDKSFAKRNPGDQNMRDRSKGTSGRSDSANKARDNEKKGDGPGTNKNLEAPEKNKPSEKAKPTPKSAPKEKTNPNLKKNEPRSTPKAKPESRPKNKPKSRSKKRR